MINLTLEGEHELLSALKKKLLLKTSAKLSEKTVVSYIKKLLKTQISTVIIKKEKARNMYLLNLQELLEGLLN